MRRRLALVWVLSVTLVGLSGGYVAWRASQVLPPPPLPQRSADTLDDILKQPHVLFLDTPDYSHRHLAVASLADPQDRVVTDITCSVVYATRPGGVCLGVEGTVAYSYNARSCERRFIWRGIFDANSGAGSGCRQDRGSLEDFTVLKDGTRFAASDFNFWGTTFSGIDSRFFATLGSGNRTYLVEGDLDRREMHVLRENVECPSLSPDRTRIAFKKRTDTVPGNWRLAVLDLATLQDTLLTTETRSIDDQVEWLDDTHLLYAVPEVRQPGQLSTDIWVASTASNEAPRVYLADAVSPAVVH